MYIIGCVFFQAEDGIRDLVRSRGLGDVYKRQPGGHYDILIGTGLLQQASAWAGLPRAGHAVVVSNPTVQALHGAALQLSLIHI